MKTFKPGDLLFVEDFLNDQIVGTLHLVEDRKDGVYVKRIDSFPTSTVFLLTKLNKAALSGFVVHLLAENQTWRINSRYIKVTLMPLKNKLAKFVPGKLYKSSDFLVYTQWWRQDSEGYSIRTLLSIEDKVVLYLGPLNSKHGEFLIDGQLWNSSISSDDRPSFASEEKEMFGEKRPTISDLIKNS